MPTFLDLPVEIRNQIYLHILDSPPAPISKSLPCEEYLVKNVYNDPDRQYLLRMPRANLPWLDLLLVSKSVKAELTTLLESNSVRKNRSLATYHAHLRPQSLEWLKINVPESTARHLHLTVVCKGINDAKYWWQKPSLRGNVQWKMLLGMLHYFFDHGPSPSGRVCALSLPLDSVHVRLVEDGGSLFGNDDSYDVIRNRIRCRGNVQSLAGLLRDRMTQGSFAGQFEELSLECEGMEWDGKSFRSTHIRKIDERSLKSLSIPGSNVPRPAIIMERVQVQAPPTDFLETRASSRFGGSATFRPA